MTEPAAEGQPSPEDERPVRPASWGGLLGACVAVLALLTLAEFVGGRWWFIDLFSHYALHYALCALGAFALLVVRRRWRWAALAAALVVVNVLRIAPLFIPPGSVPADGLPLRVLFANLSYRNRDADAVTAMVADADPDVIVFAEATPFWARALAPLRADYPTTTVAAREGPFGIALFSRVACPAARMERLGATGVPTLVARLQADGGEIVIMGAHPPPPVIADAAREQSAQFAGIAASVRESAAPVVLVGDLNCTPYSPHFRSLLRQSGLKDARRGFGIKATWPAALGPTGLPIDHCLVSDGIGVKGFALGPAIGSDHRPLIIDLVIPQGLAARVRRP